ncbi:hypothetical protein [Brevundimonas sp.]|uniref:hypothetical protein n=1 Tax=Brevundimonas sp. TaxID=1871086 RepID=UPI0035B3608F
MATLVQRVLDLAGRIATEIKAVKTLLDGKQPLASTLTALAARTIGVGSPSSMLDRQSGDGRYALTAHAHPISGVTGLQSALDERLPLAGGTLSGDLTLSKSGPWLTLDSPSTGPSGTDQAAGISLGESGAKGSAALHMTYVGDGSGWLGMGVVDPTTSIPANWGLKFAYTSQQVTFATRPVIDGGGSIALSSDLDAKAPIIIPPSSGAHANFRVTSALANYRFNGNPTGAIVFRAGSATAVIMNFLEIIGGGYASGAPLPHLPGVIRAEANFYRANASAIYYPHVSQHGSSRPLIRPAIDPSGHTCLVLGDVDSAWKYPHISLLSAMAGHNGVTDTYLTGWTSALITDLTGYTWPTHPTQDASFATLADTANAAAPGSALRTELDNAGGLTLLGEITSFASVAEFTGIPSGFKQLRVTFSGISYAYDGTNRTLVVQTSNGGGWTNFDLTPLNAVQHAHVSAGEVEITNYTTATAHIRSSVGWYDGAGLDQLTMVTGGAHSTGGSITALRIGLNPTATLNGGPRRVQLWGVR